MQRLKALPGVDRDILYLVLMNASASVAKIARTVGCSPNLVQSALRKLHAKGLIYRRVMIDAFRLGLTRHSIYLSLSSEGQRERERFVSYLVEHMATSVVMEVAGDYDLLVGVLVRNAAELVQFQGELAAAFPGAVLRKEMAATVRHSVFGEKSLVTDKSLYSECSYAMSSETSEADIVDRQILFLIGDGVIRSSAQLSRGLGIPPSTVEYRLKKLRERGIICGDMFEVKGNMLGLLKYLVLVEMKGITDSLHADFVSFCRVHPYIPHISFEVGHWDYQVGAAVPEVQQLNRLLEELNDQFRGHILSAKPMPMFKARKVRDYPLNPRLPDWTEVSEHGKSLIGSAGKDVQNVG